MVYVGVKCDHRNARYENWPITIKLKGDNLRSGSLRYQTLQKIRRSPTYIIVPPLHLYLGSAILSRSDIPVWKLVSTAACPASSGSLMDDVSDCQAEGESDSKPYSRTLIRTERNAGVAVSTLVTSGWFRLCDWNSIFFNWGLGEGLLNCYFEMGLHSTWRWFSGCTINFVNGRWQHGMGIL